jgi:hypothetical protein
MRQQRATIENAAMAWGQPADLRSRHNRGAGGKARLLMQRIAGCVTFTPVLCGAAGGTKR